MCRFPPEDEIGEHDVGNPLTCMLFFRHHLRVMPATKMKPSMICEGLVRYLGKEENRTHVLRSVSLSLYPGKVYSVVGPSGCGKSTLLYVLGLLDRPDAGSIFLGDMAVSSFNDSDLTYVRNYHLGFVFQFHFLIKEFTALENVVIPMLKSGKIPEEKQHDRAMALLDCVGLAEKASRRANHLSGGEQQRVAIARALANSPEVILADEPTGNLDTANSKKVFDLMKAIAHEQGVTMLVVTHNPAVADASDVILEMRDGQFTRETHKK